MTAWHLVALNCNYLYLKIKKKKKIKKNGET